MPDYADVIQLHRRQAAARGPSPEELEAHRRVQGMVALRMEVLQGGDDWGVFVAHVDVLRGQDQAALDQLRAQLDDGQLVGDDLSRATLRIQRLLGRLDAYREALAIPSRVIAQVEAEKKVLDASPGVEGRA